MPDHPPGGRAGAWLEVVITEAVVTVITLLWPGADNALFGQAYSIKSSRGVPRAFFELMRLGSLAVMIVLGLAFWGLGERRRPAGLLGMAVTVQGTPERERAQAADVRPAQPGLPALGSLLDAVQHEHVCEAREGAGPDETARGDPGVAPES